MPTHTNLSITRRPELLNRFGISNTCLHTRIHEGTMPPPISLGGRSVGWLEHELDAVLAAMASGQNKEAIKQVIERMLKDRKKLMTGTFAEKMLEGAA